MSTTLPSGLPIAQQPGLLADPLSQPGGTGVGLADLGRSSAVPRFEDALRAATAPPQIDAPVQLAQVNQAQAPVTTDAGPDAVSAARGSDAADARSRAAEGLDLRAPDAPAPGATSGTTILDGLERLRGVFDTQFNSVGNRLEGTVMDVSSMMALQAEVVQFTVLVDVSSKLAGKSTQAMDSLMKGQ